MRAQETFPEVLQCVYGKFQVCTVSFVSSAYACRWVSLVSCMSGLAYDRNGLELDSSTSRVERLKESLGGRSDP